MKPALAAARVDRAIIVVRDVRVILDVDAFTEQGVAMLSSVLRSRRAVTVSFEIMRAFVSLRQVLHPPVALARRLDRLEARCDTRFRVVFEAIRGLMTPPPAPRKRIGCRA
jgi:hypothetical protein